MTVRTEIAKPVLLAGEEAESYHQLRIKVYEAVEPQDFIEELFVEDIVELTWEGLRLRRLKNNAINSRRAKTLRKMSGKENDMDILLEHTTGLDPSSADGEIDDLGFDWSEVHAETFVAMIEKVRAIDGLIERVEIRRANALKEIDRRRNARATYLRVNPVPVEAEFSEVGEAGAIPQNS